MGSEFTEQGVNTTPGQEPAAADTATDGENEAIPKTLRHCSFCGKPQKDVLALICGPGGIMICDECVGLCCEVLTEQYGTRFTVPLMADITRASAKKMKPDAFDMLASAIKAVQDEMAKAKGLNDGKVGVSSSVAE